MLEIRKTAIFLDEEALLELERLIIGQNKDAAFIYLKNSVYEKVVRTQRSL